MLVSWKLAQIARAESRTHDALLADEIFDAAFMSTKQYLSLRNPTKRNSAIDDHVWFPHWSSTGQKTQKELVSLFDEMIPSSWESYCYWMALHNITNYLSGRFWTNACIKDLTSIESSLYQSHHGSMASLKSMSSISSI